MCPASHFFFMSNESFIEGQPMYTRCKNKDCQKNQQEQ
jgi:hypothetical protein